MDPLREQRHDSDTRLLATLAAATDDELRADSLLPGWTRAHVVAHLALNAEALAGVLRGIRTGRPTTMYADDGARDRDIDALAAASPADLRVRCAAAVAAFDAALDDWPDHLDAVRVERTPGSPVTFAAGEIAVRRWTEVEIHHADLGTAYGPARWPVAFAVRLVDALLDGDRPYTVHASDVGRTWQAGPDDNGGHRQDGPTVSGTAADLGWWLSGRRPSPRLTSDGGELPRIEEW